VSVTHTLGYSVKAPARVPRSRVSREPESASPHKLKYIYKDIQTFYPKTTNQAGYVIRLFLLFLMLPLFAQAQIKVNINSGNPAYPFPQFQPYVNRDGVFENVGTHNNVGVPHAEMENTIRDAYQIMMNRATKLGGGVGGKSYIKYRSNPQCSEGNGYGLLGAAAMADKETFDGMWLYIHDSTLNKVKRYADCKDASPGYLYSQLPGWTGAGANSATDGDVDIALALLQAYKQWGEFMGIDDACGNPISYKQAAIDFLKALTDTVSYSNGSLLSGDIGIDGYFKGGDSWAELSGWSTPANTPQVGITKRVEQPGPTAQYFDYTAPSYFHAFADFLSDEDSARYAWNILQFRRAEASTDWLIGEMYKASPKNIPISGNVAVSGTTATFKFTGNMGEDFRLGWRTTLNYLWHGTPTGTWNPATHQVEWGKTNTYEQDMAKRYAEFLWDARQSPWNHACVPSVGTDPFDHWGPMTLITNTGMDGSIPTEAFYFLNWLPAVGSPSAVIAQNFDRDLMADLYRYLEIEWDVETPGDGYLTSVPVYYHGWYRLLGLLVLSGNYAAPADLKPTANTKVYCAIDKSFAFEKDTLTYTIDWRNFGSVDAVGTTVVDTLHKDFTFVSATNGGVYNNTSHTVTWNVGTLPGFKTATGIPPTTGKAALKVLIANATEKQYRNKVSISCANGTGWTSNDYPNRITAVMERNHFDIARRALLVHYTASKEIVKPGGTVDFTIDFENSSDAGWINGGRAGVSFSFSQIDKVQGEGIVGTKNTMRTRLYNDASEAYIDFGNYRISYFLYDTAHMCIGGQTGCTNGWAFTQTITEGINKADVKLVHEMIVPGEDPVSKKKWNQRLIVQFSDPEDPQRVENLTTIDRHVSGYRGIAGRIHRGGTSPLRLVWFFNASDWKPVNWGDAWSWDPNISQDDKDDYFPVTDDWTDPDPNGLGTPVNHWNRKACKTATKTVNNILVEEWDGYTWRRVAGNGPMPGREVNNVIVRDTIPDGFSFVDFTAVEFNGIPVTTNRPTVTGNVISWSIPKMQISEKGTIKFTAKAEGVCPGAADVRSVNRAWVSADKESPFADSSEIAISCDTVPKPPSPDHIDIVLDTLLIDPVKDHDIVRITLDEGTQTAVAYAVVRDKNGKFLRAVPGARWTTLDATVARAAATSPISWQGTITKAGAGSVLIVVTDPSDPALKPDTLAVTAVATPPWPAIASAVMGDANGDIIPDMLTLLLNDTFHVNQKLDSVIVEYRGSKYAYAASQVQLLGATVSFSLPGLTAADPEPAGIVTMLISVDGSKKRVTKDITDGVPPALSAVALVQDRGAAGYDTLTLLFTEDVAMPSLVGATLQLIRTATGDTVVLPVVAYKGPDLYKETKATVFNAAGIRPQEGDRLRLVPGVAGGTVTDKKKNLPHLLNPSVVIPERPSQLAGGWYTDENADGIVDAAYLDFVKKVDVAGLAVSVMFGTIRADNIAGSALSFGADSTVVKVALPADKMGSLGVKTGGTMFAQARFTLYVNEERSAPLVDRAAPVIAAAVYKVGIATVVGQSAIDSFFVDFSEPSVVAPGTMPLLFMRKSGAPYTVTLNVLSVNNLRAVFTVGGFVGTLFPETGDSVYINYGVSAVGDSTTWQTSQGNRRVTFVVQRGAVSWDVVAVPNPVNPDVVVNSYSGTAVRIVNPVNTAMPLTFDKAHISIYDAAGNPVVVKGVFKQTLAGPVFYWDATNRKHRKVGNGTYIGVITVEDEESKGVKQLKIGVARGTPAGVP